jgi:hypothetical protein
MHVKAIQVRHIYDYLLEVEFENGEIGLLTSADTRNGEEYSLNSPIWSISSESPSTQNGVCSCGLVMWT